LRELVETFLEEGAEIVAELRASLADEDRSTLHRGAHSLKSSAQDFGATQLAELSARLEARAVNTWPDRAAADVDAIGECFDDARRDLGIWLDRQP